MKKIFTLHTLVLLFFVANAQIDSKLNNNHLKAVNNKKMYTGGEALSNLIINPNPTVTSNYSFKTSVPGIGFEKTIGTTYYDLQSNACVQDRIVMHDKGISVAWTMSQQFNAAHADRGTGYNFLDFNTGNWTNTSSGAQNGFSYLTRLESSRGGWPSMLIMGSGKEASITHNTDNNYLNMTHRQVAGDPNYSWNEQIVSSVDINEVPRYLIWNRSAIGGINNNTIHMIAVTASTNFQGTLFNGLDGALVYYRSQDEGATWDRKDLQLPSLDSTNFIGMSGDVYAIDAQGETVVIAYFDDWGDSFILKSTDNGDNWTRTTFLDFPVNKYMIDAGFDLDNNDTTDHVYSTDNYGSVILDANNMAHVFYGVMQYADDDLTDESSSWYPGTNGIAYWNENFGADNYLDSVQVQNPYFTVNGNIIDTLEFSLDTIFLNSWDTITQTVNLVPTNFYEIIQFNDSLNPLVATDTVIGWESNVYSIIYDINGDSIGSSFISADTSIINNYYISYNLVHIPNNSELQDTINYLDASGLATPRGRWWSDMMNDNIIAVAPDLNGDSIVGGIDSTGGYAIYYASRASMPNAGIASNGDIYLSFSGYTENASTSTQVFRHIYITKSSDGGVSWKEPVDVTPHDIWGGSQECVFGAMNNIVDDKIRIVYQKDFEPGLAVRGDEDIIDLNEIVYLEIDTAGLFDGNVVVNPFPSSIDNIFSEEHVNIYPNPSNNITYIEINSLESNLAHISIINILGEKVKDINMQLKEGKNVKSVNTSELKKGIYFIDININNSSITQKLIISE